MIKTLLAASLLAAPLQDSTRESAPAATPAQATPPKVVVIGASVSAGAGNASELEVRRDVGLGTFLAATFAEPEEGQVTPSTVDLGSMYFFMDPLRNGVKQVRSAAAEEPTAVVALDFLFWFAYGERSREDPRRAEGLERGLRALGELKCPLVLGELPNIEHALTGIGPFGGPLVHRGMFPTDGELAEMNTRIAAWAKERGDVALVPLAGLVKQLQGGATIELRGDSWEIEEIGESLQKDRLHPTVLGTSWVAMHVADALVELELLTEERFLWKGKTVAERVVAATAEDRERKRALDARKEARKKAREARQKEKNGTEKTGEAKRSPVTAGGQPHTR